MIRGNKKKREREEDVKIEDCEEQQEKGEGEEGAEDERICRFCFDSEPPFISPCNCSGSSSYIHQSCLDRWRATCGGKGYHSCTTCHFHFRLDKTHSRRDNVVVAKFLFWVCFDIILALGFSFFVLYFVTYINCLLDPEKERNENFPEGTSQVFIDYLCGSLILFFFLGIAGIAHLLLFGAAGRAWPSNCACGGPVVALLILAGLIYGVYLTGVFVAHAFQKRAKQIYRHESAVEDKVADLRGLSKKEIDELPPVPPRGGFFMY